MNQQVTGIYLGKSEKNKTKFICPLIEKECMMINQRDLEIPKTICDFFLREEVNNPNKWANIKEKPDLIFNRCKIPNFDWFLG